ncbi:Superfamily II helicase and inactivated derivatives [Klebsiella pneumoniae]|uniref:Superfamily II helicase and inactivated derivatives n=1 Tax=Klebsiella pneumoniae TaxID=573 RepID=A0A2X3D2U1_KLEPN|nr:Superfamily II helicase and inactivated derivatives [Klebsiella pneumoniae]
MTSTVSTVLPVPVKPFVTVLYCAEKAARSCRTGSVLTQEYLWYEKQVQRNGETEIQNVKICNPLRVTAITCDADGGNFGRLLEWEDTWGERRRWAMPMEMLSGSGEELRRVLLVNGLSYISTTGEARARPDEYISLCKTGTPRDLRQPHGLAWSGLRPAG